MYATQWTRQAEIKRKKPHEITGDESMVVKTPIKGNSERLAQMQLAGQYVEAQRIGYQFGPEDKIPAEIEVLPGRNVDPVDVLKYVEAFGRRIREQMRKATEAKDVRQDSGVSADAEAGSKSESKAPGKGIPASETA